MTTETEPQRKSPALITRVPEAIKARVLRVAYLRGHTSTAEYLRMIILSALIQDEQELKEE